MFLTEVDYLQIKDVINFCKMIEKVAISAGVLRDWLECIA
jgi:hypothetical protein